MLRMLRERPNNGRFSVRTVCGKLRIFGAIQMSRWSMRYRFRRFPHSLRKGSPMRLKAFRRFRRFRKRVDLKVLAVSAQQVPVLDQDRQYLVPHLGAAHYSRPRFAETVPMKRSPVIRPF